MLAKVQPRGFILLVATTFGAAALLFALMAQAEGRSVDLSFFSAAALALAFIAIAVRFPVSAERAPGCGQCGWRVEELSFCTRCGAQNGASAGE